MPDYELIIGDAVEKLRRLPKGYADIAITDPPYNVGLEYASTDDNKENYAEWCQEWLAELERVCTGTIAISVGQANLSLWATIKKPTWWLAWWKPSAMGRCPVGFNNWEPIAVYKRSKINKQGCDVIRAPIVTTDKSVVGHPCPKPLDWAVKQIEMFAPPGCTIIDPFMGSGTTLVACKELNRNGIGIEINEKYCEIAKKRLKATCKPLFIDVSGAGKNLQKNETQSVMPFDAV